MSKSETLTDIQQNFAQIEKKLYLIAFASTKFHHFTYRENVTVKPDEAILICKIVQKVLVIKKGVHC